MPAEVVHSIDRFGFADALVCWGKEEGQDQRVRLFMRPASEGYIAFHPKDPKQFGLQPDESVGPVQVYLGRRELDRLIDLLKKARAQTKW